MSAPAVAAEPAPGARLTHDDRCDRCGAQAFVRVLLANGDLLFCGHHGRRHGDVLAEVALAVEDYTETINARPSPSANSD